MIAFVLTACDGGRKTIKFLSKLLNYITNIILKHSNKEYHGTSNNTRMGNSKDLYI